MEIRIAWSPGEARIAAMDGDTLQDFALWRPGKPDGYGDRHAVRILKSAENMGGAFVSLADGSDGFLTGQHAVGDLVSALVVRSPQGGKGLRLKPIEMAHAATEPALLARGPTPLETIAARYPDAPILIDEPAVAARIPASLRARIVRTPAAFDAHVTALCDALSEPVTELKGGVRATFTPTPALMAIDLDCPENTDRRSRATAQAGVNMAAFPDLCREIRLRNLSGAILIDPAGVTPRKRPALVPPLREALQHDPMKPQALGATALGLLEVVRTRSRPPLHELLNAPHGIGLSALRQIIAQRPTGAPPPPTLKAAISVVRALETDTVALDSFSTTYGTPLRLELAPDYPVNYWSLHI
ncbi:hypothetical protein AA101099_2378 [Neoasaia chiangmaiensis NBRC 101099]|nr:ribonuclease E/G [Neoasaia chiangmaiensis]GBR41047.1 hypothetical protein AA101099_2378 [Neoasaia chiangmaiensis NBRC 101099]GEN13633.1 hypothetical protein NCH01_00640 [Neoasaia chiangmaiensis]